MIFTWSLTELPIIDISNLSNITNLIDILEPLMQVQINQNLFYNSRKLAHNKNFLVNAPKLCTIYHIYSIGLIRLLINH